MACFCWENGLEFSTEAEFNSGGRADVVIADLKLVVEILHCEKEKDFEKKKYPLEKIHFNSDDSKECIYFNLGNYL